MTQIMFTVSALYHFTRFDDPGALRAPMVSLCEHEGIKGTILLAKEGINGTVAGPKQGIARLWAHIAALPGCSDFEHKESTASIMPFKRMKVRLKKEIVTLGVEGISPIKRVGQYVKPEDWNDLISSPDVVLIDTRNDYEVEIGTFKGALDPNIQSFSQLPDWVKQAKALEARDGKKPRVAMFCTGGIRCEKSTALMLENGFDEVFHLQGGILKYLEQVPPELSLWEGECFVFDQRVAIKHGLEVGNYDQCYACRYPLSADDMKSDKYTPGISCPHCFNQHTPEKLKALSERQKQVILAKERGIEHIGTKTKFMTKQKKKRLASKESI